MGLREEDKPNYFDRICTAFFATLAGSQFLSGQGDKARDTLIKAKELAEFFDASPGYDESDICFVGSIDGASAHDDLRAAAMDGVCNAVSQFENKEFTALLKSLVEQENYHE